MYLANIFCDILVSCEIIIVSLCSKFLQKSLADSLKKPTFVECININNVEMINDETK